MKIICTLVCLLSLKYLGAEEVFQKELEFPVLQNVEQLTFSYMGFAKAGEAYFSPNGEEIIFQAAETNEESYQIFTMKLKDRIPRMVSTGKGACTCGFFRPDGKKIIFASSHESPELLKKTTSDGKYTWDLTPYMNIYEADTDGLNLKRLTFGSAYHAECGYSPDGESIVYASNESGSMNLYTMKSDGSEVKQLTHTAHCYNGGPFFSPDGTRIIFRADRETPHLLQIFSVNIDGSEEKQLTHQHVNWAPFWHPQGNVIAYTTSKHGHGAYEIYLMNVQTGISYRLTHNSSFDGLPSFSKDGKKILWTSKRDTNACQIFMADFTMPFEL